MPENDIFRTAASIVVILIFGIVAYYLVQRSVKSLSHKQYLPTPIALLVARAARWVLILLVVLLSLGQVGIDASSIWATLSALVVLIGVGFVAVWSVLSNMLCSVLLLVFTPFQVGDEIEIIEATGGSGLRGKVIGLNMLFTSLEELSEEGSPRVVVEVPNNIFFQKTIRRIRGQETLSLEDALFSKLPSRLRS